MPRRTLAEPTPHEKRKKRQKVLWGARYEEMGCVDEDFLDDPLTPTKPCTCRFHHTKCPRNDVRLPLPCWRRKELSRWRSTKSTE
jgi:hypothetical protein